MLQANFKKAGLLALFISLVAVASWEFYLRQQGNTISYDDNEALWANNRAMVYESKDQATVLIGDSRMKYDLDIPTWESITGNHAIQLANVGSTPRVVLEDLANDTNFKGRLIINVTEGVFFSEFVLYDPLTIKKIAYYKSRTPTQRFSFQVNHVLESQFVFLDQSSFSINAMLDYLKIGQRQGVTALPVFPILFHGNSFERQSYMTRVFVTDTSMQNQVKAIWTSGRNLKRPPLTADKLDAIFNSVKVNIDKIKGRGGEVLFIRPPSSGQVLQTELKKYPRNLYWDRLLAFTGCPGIHFSDYPATSHFECPEWSHLSKDDAAIYTGNLIKILQEEKGWTFSRKM